MALVAGLGVLLVVFVFWALGRTSPGRSSDLSSSRARQEQAALVGAGQHAYRHGQTSWTV